jgi:hypothetical protein
MTRNAPRTPAWDQVAVALIVIRSNIWFSISWLPERNLFQPIFVEAKVDARLKHRGENVSFVSHDFEEAL